MPDSIITAEALRSMTSAALEDTATPDILVAEWLRWFAKRGERYLTTAANFGYFAVSLDLPIEIATELNPDIARTLLKGVRDLVPGSTVCIVEEDYEGELIYKLEIAWN